MQGLQSQVKLLKQELEASKKDLEEKLKELAEMKDKWDKRVLHPELDNLNEQIEQMKNAVELLG